jgi:hypothetical protein
LGGSEGGPDALAQLRAQWGPAIGAVVAACGGNQQATAEITPFIEQLGQQEQWQNLAAALRRILAGERQPAALLPGLDPTDTLIVVEVLRGLEVEMGGPAPEAEGQQGITLDQLLNMVAQACRPEAEPGLAAQLHGLTRQMAGDANAPTKLQALGRVLNQILSGERQPDLSALPPELAQGVESLLARLREDLVEHLGVSL